MGAAPSTEMLSHAPFCPPGNGARQIALIPFTKEYFPSPHCVLFEQFYEVRTDPSVRYYMRYRADDQRQDYIPPIEYTKEELYKWFVNITPRICYPTNAALKADMLAGNAHRIRPLPCALVFLYSTTANGVTHIPEGAVKLKTRENVYMKVIGGIGDNYYFRLAFGDEVNNHGESVNKESNATRYNYNNEQKFVRKESEQIAEHTTLQQRYQAVEQYDNNCNRISSKDNTSTADHRGTKEYLETKKNDSKVCKTPTELQMQMFITKSAGDHNMARMVILASYVYEHQCLNIIGLPRMPPHSISFKSFKTNIPFLCFLREMRDRVSTLLGCDKIASVWLDGTLIRGYVTEETTQHIFEAFGKHFVKRAKLAMSGNAQKCTLEQHKEVEKQGTVQKTEQSVDNINKDSAPCNLSANTVPCATRSNIGEEGIYSHKDDKIMHHDEKENCRINCRNDINYQETKANERYQFTNEEVMSIEDENNNNSNSDKEEDDDEEDTFLLTLDPVNDNEGMYTNNMYDEFMYSTCDIPLFNENSTIICDEDDTANNKYNINTNSSNNIDVDTNNNVSKSVNTLNNKNMNMESNVVESKNITSTNEVDVKDNANIDKHEEMNVHESDETSSKCSSNPPSNLLTTQMYTSISLSQNKRFHRLRGYIVNPMEVIPAHCEDVEDVYVVCVNSTVLVVKEAHNNGKNNNVPTNAPQKSEQAEVSPNKNCKFTSTLTNTSNSDETKNNNEFVIVQILHVNKGDIIVFQSSDERTADKVQVSTQTHTFTDNSNDNNIEQNSQEKHSSCNDTEGKYNADNKTDMHNAVTPFADKVENEKSKKEINSKEYDVKLTCTESTLESAALDTSIPSAENANTDTDNSKTQSVSYNGMWVVDPTTDLESVLLSFISDECKRAREADALHPQWLRCAITQEPIHDGAFYIWKFERQGEIFYYGTVPKFANAGKKRIASFKKSRVVHKSTSPMNWSITRPKSSKQYNRSANNSQSTLPSLLLNCVNETALPAPLISQPYNASTHVYTSSNEFSNNTNVLNVTTSNNSSNNNNISTSSNKTQVAWVTSANNTLPSSFTYLQQTSSTASNTSEIIKTPLLQTNMQIPFDSNAFVHNVGSSNNINYYNNNSRSSNNYIDEINMQKSQYANMYGNTFTRSPHTNLQMQTSNVVNDNCSNTLYMNTAQANHLQKQNTSREQSENASHAMSRTSVANLIATNNNNDNANDKLQNVIWPANKDNVAFICNAESKTNNFNADAGATNHINTCTDDDTKENKVQYIHIGSLSQFALPLPGQPSATSTTTTSPQNQMIALSPSHNYVHQLSQLPEPVQCTNHSQYTYNYKTIPSAAATTNNTNQYKQQSTVDDKAKEYTVENNQTSLQYFPVIEKQQQQQSDLQVQTHLSNHNMYSLPQNMQAHTQNAALQNSNVMPAKYTMSNMSPAQFSPLTSFPLSVTPVNINDNKENKNSVVESNAIAMSTSYNLMHNKNLPIHLQNNMTIVPVTNQVYGANVVGANTGPFMFISVPSQTILSQTSTQPWQQQKQQQQQQMPSTKQFENALPRQQIQADKHKMSEKETIDKNTYHLVPETNVTNMLLLQQQQQEQQNKWIQNYQASNYINQLNCATNSLANDKNLFSIPDKMGQESLPHYFPSANTCDYSNMTTMPLNTNAVNYNQKINLTTTTPLPLSPSRPVILHHSLGQQSIQHNQHSGRPYFTNTTINYGGNTQQNTTANACFCTSGNNNSNNLMESQRRYLPNANTQNYTSQPINNMAFDRRGTINFTNTPFATSHFSQPTNMTQSVDKIATHQQFHQI